MFFVQLKKLATKGGAYGWFHRIWITMWQILYFKVFSLLKFTEDRDIIKLSKTFIDLSIT